MKKRIMVLLSCFIFLSQVCLIPAAHAAMLSTKMTMQDGGRYAHENGTYDRQAIAALLERDEAKSILKAYGVDAEQIQSRIDKLTGAEIAMINQQAEALPAGSGILSLIGLIVVILVVLELLGVSNVFRSF
ncbi:MAG: PA2779 family protein [Pseudomonadales bacterium]|nr:PA2779 family protein [Pseudomonadales bacterium]